jgi:penicillin-binding protein 1A
MHVGLLLVRAHDLEVVADFLHGERDVLVGLHLDLRLEVALVQAARHLDDLGDRGVAADRDRRFLRARAAALQGALDRLADRFGVDDRLLVDRAVRRGLRRVRLDAVLVAALRQLDELDRGGRYVQSDQGPMRRVELQVPLRVYTRTGGLIAQIGEQRRIPVTFDEIPEVVRQAVLAAEDDRFFEHHGIDWGGVARAMMVNVASAGRSQGASTITMQAARNMFLSLDKTWRRKLSEMFVTYRMERDFTKEEILATYLNVIFFGQRSYGVAAAAETFFGKGLSELTLAEAATLAGIVQAPARFNPITSPSLAANRRTYVLRRMVELGYVDQAAADAAAKQPILSRGYAPLFDVEAPYVAELARQELVSRYGEAAVNHGYRVFTTVDGRLQAAANRALRIGLIEYDRRHGYRGPLGKAELPAGLDPAKLDALLVSYAAVGLLQPAIVTSLRDTRADFHVKGQGKATSDWQGLSWARPLRGGKLGSTPRTAADILKPGDIVHVITDRRGNAQLAQVPDAQSALVAVDPEDGAIVSMVGGFDFYTNKFNRVTQARRQPGSGFKPFLYSAALENGFTPGTIVLDTPIVVDDAGVEGAWRPENSSREFSGPMRLREGLVRSRNLVSIRILRDIGTQAAIDHAARFGFDPKVMPNNLTLALGTLPATPLQMAIGFSAFANGGFKVDPYFIERIENAQGEVLFQAAPKIACPECEVVAAVETGAAGAAGAAAGGTDDPGAASGGATADVAAGEGAASTGSDTGTQGAGRPPLFAGQPAEPLMPPELLAARSADAPAGLRELAATPGPMPLPPERLAPRILSPQNAWLMNSIMRDVVRRGTAVRARALGRSDLAGKTGTSNDARDVWFNGFKPGLVASVWVGFDEEKSLGAREEGGNTALPIWVHFMREALRSQPERALPRPAGLVDLRVSGRTGYVTDPSDPEGVVETFMVEHLPPGADPSAPGYVPPPSQGPGSGDPLF